MTGHGGAEGEPVSKRRLSVGDRMKRCKTREDQLRLAREWRQEWEDSHIAIIDDLKHAIDDGDDDRMRMLFAELHTFTAQKHVALDKMFDRLTSPVKEDNPC